MSVFYRRLNDELFTAADLTGAFERSPIFILGGSPCLKTLPLDKLQESRLPTLALNNVVYSYPNPTMWLTADKPSCYASHFFARPDIIKFGYMNYRDDIVPATGRPFKDHPMMLFYTAVEAFSEECFFTNVPAVAWWKSVFPIALQVAWRLGARRVYLVGCSFMNNGPQPYSWETKLNRFQTLWSQATYDEDVARLKRLKPHFDEHEFQVFSCTPESRANKIFPMVKLADAIDYELMRLPNPVPPSQVKHSSDFRPGAEGSVAAH